MKLTHYIRDAFITSVMNDVPAVDYMEEYRKTYLAVYLPTLPKEVQAMWASNALRPFLKTVTIYRLDGGFAIPTADPYQDPKLVDTLTVTLNELKVAHDAQRNKHAELRQQVKSAAYACTTTKQLRELLPEFDRYLPAEDAKTSRQLPVVQNIMAEFVKAGWPAKKAPKAATK